VLELCSELLVQHFQSTCDAVNSFILQPYIAGRAIGPLNLDTDTMSPNATLVEYFLPTDDSPPLDYDLRNVAFRSVDEVLDETDHVMDEGLAADVEDLLSNGTPLGENSDVEMVLDDKDEGSADRENNLDSEG